MWFDVDQKGLAALLEHRGKAFAIFELIQNAWDANPTKVSVQLAPIAGAPFAQLVVEDDSAAGWSDLSQAFTLFKRSTRSGDPTKRGRYSMGEKLVLSLCRLARISSISGTIRFDESGRHSRPSEKRERGTLFQAEIRMTRDELADVTAQVAALIPPVPTTFNSEPIAAPAIVGRFSAKLPTVIADEEGNLRPSMRLTDVEAYRAEPDSGEILELGIPVCAADFPWRLNVLQKVPLNMERNSVTDAFRRALQVAAVNALANQLSDEQAAAPWASEAMGDSRIKPDALAVVVAQRFGPRAVIATPGDPLANATAQAAGVTVIHGGALSGDAWANIKKHALIPAASSAFPSPVPTAQQAAAQLPQLGICPTCKRPMPDRDSMG